MAAVHALAHDVASRLFTIGVSEAQLRDAVARGLNARKLCTPFHPPNAPGFYQWAEIVVALREVLTPLGWEKDDTGGFSTIVSPDGLLAITVATGDERTAREGLPMPATKYRRGAMTHAAVEVNQQLRLDLVTGKVIFPEEEEQAKRETWWLLVHTRHDEMRLELSCPKGVGEDGRIDAWTERVILEPLPIDGTLPLTTDELDLVPIDVPVERR
jgi:hypothetical protein